MAHPTVCFVVKTSEWSLAGVMSWQIGLCMLRGTEFGLLTFLQLVEKLSLPPLQQLGLHLVRRGQLPRHAVSRVAG